MLIDVLVHVWVKKKKNSLSMTNSYLSVIIYFNLRKTFCIFVLILVNLFSILSP